MKAFRLRPLLSATNLSLAPMNCRYCGKNMAEILQFGKLYQGLKYDLEAKWASSNRSGSRQAEKLHAHCPAVILPSAIGRIDFVDIFLRMEPAP